LAKYKAKLVARDDLQPTSKKSTYAATLAAKFFRTLIAYAAQYDLKCNQYDIMEAFLNAIRKSSEKLYAELPAEYKKSGKCIKVLKAIYKLKNSLLLWYKKLNEALENIGFILSKKEPCLFYLPNRKICILFYMNDILCLYHKNNISNANEIIRALKTKYKIKNEKGVK
jgi:hypothetical protein